MLIILDTETTSIIPGQICQLSYVMIDRDRVTPRNYYFTVDEMLPASQAVHGLSIPILAAMSQDTRFADHAQQILADMKSADVVAAHNLDFDMRFLQAEFGRCGLEYKPEHGLCTMYYFTKIIGLPGRNGKLKPPSLRELTAFFKVTQAQITAWSKLHFGGGGSAHDARYDVAATYLCICEAIKRGVLRNLFVSERVDEL